jgi:hypothetical protein
MRTITVTRDAQAPFSMTIDLVERFFQSPHQLSVGPTRSVRAAVVAEAGQIRDETDATMRHEALVIRWQPRSFWPLPDLHGLLTVRVNAPATEVTIRSEYSPPLGVLGRVFDALVGHRIAQSTLRILLEDICAYVESEYEIRRLQYPTLTGAEH